MNELSIIENLKEGGQEELDMIYKNYREEFISWIIKNYSCTLEDAKDIYQFSILTFYENILSERLTQLDSSVKTYLFAIGKNKALELNKSSNRYNLQFESNLIASPTENHEDHLLKESNLEKVEKCLQTLGDPCKKLLILYYYKRKSMEQIAKILDYKNTDTAKNLKYKCLQRLKRLFDNKELDLSS